MTACIGPLVIGTDERTHAAAILLGQQCSAMGADVMKSANVFHVLAQDNERIGVECDRKKVTWLWDLAGVTDKDPSPAPDLVPFICVEPRVLIKPAGQS